MNGIWEEYFDDGQKTKGSFRDGKEDGVWEFYVKEDGKDGKYILYMILTFKDGELIPEDEP